MGKFAGIAVLAVAIVAGYFAYGGAFYPTGRQYYAVCWEKRHAEAQTHASDPYRDVIWSNCETIARRAMFEAGMIPAWHAEDERRGRGCAEESVPLEGSR
jgi:hypothetical protein